LLDSLLQEDLYLSIANMKEVKIFDALSEDESSDGEDLPSDLKDTDVLMYPKETIEKIGKSSTDPPMNFENMIEKHRDNNVSATIFPSVPFEDVDQEEEEDVDIVEVIKNVDGGVEAQIIELRHLVEMTKEQSKAMEDVSEALEKVLKAEFPECKAFPFGSSASGLGFRDCDLDIHVELGKNIKDETFDLKSGIWGKKFRTRKLFEILRRAERFKSAVMVLNARTPIIQLREKLTRIKCDVSVVSNMGVKNTEFLAFCREQDSRFLPLVTVIKYFCREHGITSSGKGDHVNNYTLVLMLIFFLQRRGILHPLEVLQKGMEREEVEGWNFAFCQDMSQLPELKPNPASTFELLLQFFQFYVNFPFDSVICPLVGQSVKKNSMRQGICLPKVLEGAPSFGRKGEKLELNKALIVQDPFELSRNVGHAVSRDRLARMLKEFKTAARLIKDIKTGKEDVGFWMLLERGMVSYRDILSFQHYEDFQGFSDDEAAQDLTDDDKIMKKERWGYKKTEGVEESRGGNMRSEEESESAVTRETESAVTRETESAFKSSKAESISRPTMMEVKQFLFQQQSLRFPLPKSKTAVKL